MARDACLSWCGQFCHWPEYDAAELEGNEKKIGKGQSTVSRMRKWSIYQEQSSVEE
jgi:hypothetical protein